MKQEWKLSYDYRNLLTQGHTEHPNVLVTQLILQCLTHQATYLAKEVAWPVHCVCMVSLFLVVFFFFFTEDTVFHVMHLPSPWDAAKSASFDKAMK